MNIKLAPFIIKNSDKLDRKMKILLIDGDDPRGLQAAQLLQDNDKIELTLLVEQDLKSGLKSLNINENSNQYESFVQQLMQIRQGKEDEATIRQMLKTRPYYGMMLLKLGYFDGVVGGLAYTSADILRAAFKVVGPKRGVKTISSLMLMIRNEELYVFSDISINVNPTTPQLVDIANNSANFLETLNVNPRVAFLSFSTQGSAVTPESTKVAEAHKLFNLQNPHRLATGEIQFDAAFDTEVLAKKYKKPEYNKRANLYVFPDLGAGNIGYKIAQRLGGFDAFGPIICGSSLPVNDLSRGASLTDLVNTIYITALQVEKK